MHMVFFDFGVDDSDDDKDIGEDNDSSVAL
jgi:hypothetical protein